jgi:hypothetical protein
VGERGVLAVCSTWRGFAAVEVLGTDKLGSLNPGFFGTKITDADASDCTGFFAA